MWSDHYNMISLSCVCADSTVAAVAGNNVTIEFAVHQSYYSLGKFSIHDVIRVSCRTSISMEVGCKRHIVQSLSTSYLCTLMPQGKDDSCKWLSLNYFYYLLFFILIRITTKLILLYTKKVYSEKNVHSIIVTFTLDKCIRITVSVWNKEVLVNCLVS